MALRPATFGFERRNPLPSGRYWTMRIGQKQIENFDAWLAKWRRVGALKVLASDLEEAGPFANQPATAFVLWEIVTPGVVVWEGPGLPDKAPPHVASRDDVEKGPVILEPAERLEDAAKAVTRGSESFGVLVFVVAVLFLLSKKD